MSHQSTSFNDALWIIFMFCLVIYDEAQQPFYARDLSPGRCEDSSPATCAKIAMQFFVFCFTLAAVAESARIVQSNDDGWAEKNIRVLNEALVAAGNNVVLSAPADNESGRGSLDVAPTPRTSPCEFDSCPADSPAIGADPENPRLEYVNSYPVTSIKNGIKNLAPRFFNGSGPDLAVTGFNVGANLGITVQISGTVGAAVQAVKDGIPAIAFSGTTGSQISYTEETPLYAQVYADLSTNITMALIDSGKPYLPDGIWLNVNFPAVSDNTCNEVSDFHFVLSRINTGFLSPNDVETCGSTRLPTERSVVSSDGCYASISPGDVDKFTADAESQAVVLKKLGHMLSCLP